MEPARTSAHPSPPSITGQPEAALGGPRSVIVRQRADHVRLHELIERVRSTTGAEQDEALTEMCRLVFPHAFAEESVLFPVVRKYLPEGEALTVEIEHEHQEVNEIWSAVDRSRRGDPGREELIERAIATLDHDVRGEEDDLLPRLREVLDDRQLQRLGIAWDVVRVVSPTRSHAVVSRRPPGNVLAALPLTLIDRTRDGLDRAARRVPEPAATGTRVASRALAGVAGAVERFPLYQRGEDASTRTGRTELEG